MSMVDLAMWCGEVDGMIYEDAMLRAWLIETGLWTRGNSNDNRFGEKMVRLAAGCVMFESHAVLVVPHFIPLSTSLDFIC